MAYNPRLKFNDWELRLLPAAQKFVDELGEKIAADAGEGYEYRPPTRNQVRDRGAIMAVSIRAKYDNAKRMTLLRCTLEARQ